MCAESSVVFRFGRIFSGPNFLFPPPRKSRPNSYGLGLLILSITNLCASSETFYFTSPNNSFEELNNHREHKNANNSPKTKDCYNRKGPVFE